MPQVIFNGPAGRLEGRYHHSKVKNAPLGIVLHPHPEHGGTMNNKVTYHLYQTLADRGFSVLRFNFRGVGLSQGSFDRGEGELSDATAALDWLQNLNPNAPYTWVSGFSFGAWIGMQLLMRRPEVRGFIAVSPPANMYDFTFLAPCPTSGLIVQGTKDAVVPEPHVEKLVQRLRTQRGIEIDYRTIDGAGHFFNEQIGDLTAHIHDHMDVAAKRTVVKAPIALIEKAA